MKLAPKGLAAAGASRHSGGKDRRVTLFPQANGKPIILLINRAFIIDKCQSHADAPRFAAANVWHPDLGCRLGVLAGTEGDDVAIPGGMQPLAGEAGGDQ